jgi:hypothetical protein
MNRSGFQVPGSGFVFTFGFAVQGSGFPVHRPLFGATRTPNHEPGTPNRNSNRNTNPEPGTWNPELRSLRWP